MLCTARSRQIHGRFAASHSAYDNAEQFPWLLFIRSFSFLLWFTEFRFFFLFAFPSLLVSSSSLSCCLVFFRSSFVRLCFCFHVHVHYCVFDTFLIVIATAFLPFALLPTRLWQRYCAAGTLDVPELLLCLLLLFVLFIFAWKWVSKPSERNFSASNAVATKQKHTQRIVSCAVAAQQPVNWFSECENVQTWLDKINSAFFFLVRCHFQVLDKQHW